MKQWGFAVLMLAGVAGGWWVSSHWEATRALMAGERPAPETREEVRSAAPVTVYVTEDENGVKHFSNEPVPGSKPMEVRDAATPLEQPNQQPVPVQQAVSGAIKPVTGYVEHLMTTEERAREAARKQAELAVEARKQMDRL